jgi:ATP-binding cassette subfamily B protein/ATP-binding cassette subfamily C protein LapB
MLVYDKAVGNALHETLWALFIGMAIALALELVLRVTRLFLVEHAGARWDVHTDAQLVRRMLAAPLSSPLPVGEVLARYRELGATREVLSAQFLLPLADVPFVLLFLLVLLCISPWLVVVPVVMSALLVACNVAVQTLAKRRQKVSNQAHSVKLGYLTDLLLTRESLRDPHAAAMVESAMRKPSQEGARAASQARLWAQMAQQFTTVGVSLVSALTLLVGVFLIEGQALSVGGLSSSTVLSSRVVVALCGLVPVLTRWEEFLQALKSLTVVVGGPASDAQGAPSGATALAGAGRATGAADGAGAVTQGRSAFQTEGLRVDGLYYTLHAGQEKERHLLAQMSFSIAAGQLVVVVGASGAGKSTLLRLLAGHLAPSKGRISYAAVVVDSEQGRRWMATQLAYKPQEPVFMGGTVKEVLAPNQSHLLPDARAVQVLRTVGLGPALDQGFLGLESPVGTNGAGISGGQRQMLALARALLAERDLMLLDEPTLGLDRTAQEGLIQGLLALRAQGKALVVATHTSELIHVADRVLVLERGKLVADAPPQALMRA